MHWTNNFEPIWWLLPIFFLLAYGLYYLKMQRNARKLAIIWKNFWLKASLRTLVFLLLLISFLGPIWGLPNQQENTANAKDIIVAIDLSASMDAIDIVPSRLEKVKFELGKFIEKLNNDRLGLIIFSYDAYMQCPLTSDKSAIHLFLRPINTANVPQGGTDLGAPLALAYQKLKPNDNDMQSELNNKILLLISDGEDFGEKTAKQAQALADLGVKIFTLGIGTQTGGLIPDRRTGFKIDPTNGQQVLSKLNSDALQTIAQIGKGQYFQIDQQQNQFELLIKAIENAKGSPISVQNRDTSSNHYFYFLLLALILFVFDLAKPLKIIDLV